MTNGRISGNGAVKPSSSVLLEKDTQLEITPGGMLVQKRKEEDDGGRFPSPPRINLRISYGALRYKISVSSQATFGEVKKALVAETGLQLEDQQLLYHGRERKNGDYLDAFGVKNKSKVTLMEDPSSIERRYVETKKQARLHAAHRAISSVAMEVDNLANQVSAIEGSISNGVKVPEVQITTLIEMLMRQAVKLDSISADGDASKEKILQGMRLKKCVEILDLMKISNAKVKPVVVTTKWETFDPPLAAAPPWHLLD